MVSNEELLKLANDSITELYNKFKNYNEYTETLTKGEMLLQTFNDNLTFEEFFGHLLDKKKNKDMYKEEVAALAAVIIEEKNGKITINDLVDIFVQYDESESNYKKIQNETKKEENEEIEEYEEENLFQVIQNGERYELNDIKNIPTIDLEAKEDATIYIKKSQIELEKNKLQTIRRNRNKIFSKK